MEITYFKVEGNPWEPWDTLLTRKTFTNDERPRDTIRPRTPTVKDEECLVAVNVHHFMVNQKSSCPFLSVIVVQDYTPVGRKRREIKMGKRFLFLVYPIRHRKKKTES